MTANQFRAALKNLGLSQARAAEFLKISLRTAHGYANGEPIPKPTAKLLRLMVRLKLKPEDVK
jgi:transcriptional regulator with XRE-family HTH domain